MRSMILARLDYMLRQFKVLKMNGPGCMAIFLGCERLCVRGEVILCT